MMKLDRLNFIKHVFLPDGKMANTCHASNNREQFEISLLDSGWVEIKYLLNDRTLVYPPHMCDYGVSELVIPSFATEVVPAIIEDKPLVLKPKKMDPLRPNGKKPIRG